MVLRNTTPLVALLVAACAAAQTTGSDTISRVIKNVYVYNEPGSGANVPERQEFSEFPLDLGDWTCDGRATMEVAARFVAATNAVLFRGRLPTRGWRQALSAVDLHGARPERGRSASR